MNTTKRPVTSGNLRSVLFLVVALSCAIVSTPTLSRANLQATITLMNNSGREIDHLYTSPLDRKAWSADQLPEGVAVASGESFALTNMICEGDQIRVIAEDQDGCFIYAVASCQESSTWTINSTTPRDCGN